ncbi:MAG: hypothetical protein QG657_3544 [Acidobacteriota bacterium]|nr:hypothetical protein [Acidobacteriota bacterium]
MGMLKKNFLLLFLILAGASLMADTGKIDISGYFENRFFLLERRDIPWENTGEKFQAGDYNRLRLKLNAPASEKVTVNLAVDLFTFHGFMTSPLGTYGAPVPPGTETDKVQVALDRAFVDIYFKKFDISIGKQRLAMGVSYLWAPLDVFNRVNIFEPKEEKPGANAFKIYVPLGKASSLSGVFAPVNRFHASRSGLRAQVQVFNVDAALTIIRAGDTKTSIYGLDLRGENIIGWWLEAGYFVSPLNKVKKIVLGFDYTFPLKSGLYWLNEFFYDSGGGKNCSDYDFNLLLSGKRFTLGRLYFFSLLRYAFSDFLSASLGYIGNWGDGSYLIYPSLQYEISRAVLISSGLYIPLGNKRGEYNVSKRNIYFLWLKVNF